MLGVQYGCIQPVSYPNCQIGIKLKSASVSFSEQVQCKITCTESIVTSVCIVPAAYPCGLPLWVTQGMLNTGRKKGRRGTPWNFTHILLLLVLPVVAVHHATFHLRSGPAISGWTEACSSTTPLAGAEIFSSCLLLLHATFLSRSFPSLVACCQLIAGQLQLVFIMTIIVYASHYRRDGSL